MRNFISIITIGIALMACNKPSNNNTPTNTGTQMPKPSTSGANVLACKVDGVVHVYSGTPSIGNNHTGVVASYRYYNKVFNQWEIRIDATNLVGYNDGIYLDILYDTVTSYPFLNTLYRLRSDQSPASSYVVGGTIEYAVDSNTSYVIFTRVDSMVVSGKFELYGIRADSTKVSLTEGIFDISRKQ